MTVNKNKNSREVILSKNSELKQMVIKIDLEKKILLMLSTRL